MNLCFLVASNSSKQILEKSFKVTNPWQTMNYDYFHFVQNKHMWHPSNAAEIYDLIQSMFINWNNEKNLSRKSRTPTMHTSYWATRWWRMCVPLNAQTIKVTSLQIFILPALPKLSRVLVPLPEKDINNSGVREILQECSSYFLAKKWLLHLRPQAFAWEVTL